MISLFDFLDLVTIASHPSSQLFFNLRVVVGLGVDKEFGNKFSCIGGLVLMRELIARIGQTKKIREWSPAVFDAEKSSEKCILFKLTYN